MAVNSMTFQQSATLINTLKQQMTGETSIVPVDESEFVAVGTTLLHTVSEENYMCRRFLK